MLTGVKRKKGLKCTFKARAQLFARRVHFGAAVRRPQTEAACLPGHGRRRANGVAAIAKTFFPPLGEGLGVRVEDCGCSMREMGYGR